MKYKNFLLERYGSEENNILKSFLSLEDIYAKSYLPQVGSRRYKFYILNNKIISDEIPDNVLVDYIVLPNGGFIIGKEHYKMSDKAQVVKAAGEIKILNGKIIYISNESGHYQTTKEELTRIVDAFNKEKLLDNNIVINYLYENNSNRRYPW
jgi:hypothetical protein